MIQISGYQIHEKIGEGGSSEVFRATRLENQQKAALKLLHEKYSGDPAMRSRLQREARVIGSLNHPNIVKIYQSGSYEQRFYMILEYLSGGSLGQFERFSPRRRLEIMIQVCDGIACIHSLGIVHRDLKPSNIMFGEDGLPRLVDFGISLFSRENYTRLTHTNMVMGTLSYMSPEQQAEPGQVDHRTDIYSIGSILYEVFTGKRTVGRFRDPRDMIPNFPEELERAILTCLDHDPKKRFGSIGDLQKSLIDLYHDGLFSEGNADTTAQDFVNRIGIWIKQLESGTAAQRLEARRRIGQNARPEDVPQLIRICESSATEVRAAIIPIFGKLGAKEAYDFLIDQLANPLLARDASIALAFLGNRAAAQHLIPIVKKQAPYSYGSLLPLAVLGDEKDLKHALPYLKSKDSTDREAAIKAFEHAKSKRYLKPLRKQYKLEPEARLKDRLGTLVHKLEQE
ncbi:Non-specific serine/threonine protein kinase [Sulfidibacter corallicola]|uniref:Protein kinase n=1 Tax=Sulfidibacter corallicola TaxID=2818388 RepID=A0A8A4TW74_SULCO|nr:protein kinase [Sulfidibacter corallicola]QTD53607.1 protein kinase [Sulfidibacter corallicola]